MNAQTCVVLTSSMVSIAEQKYQIGHLKQLLDGNKIAYTEVDCSLEENKETRNHYFEASGIRANYPQVFLQDPEGKDIQYIGSFKEIQVRTRHQRCVTSFHAARFLTAMHT
ncbi:hypothetical protein BBJ28_00015443 [Nothophytophthora sp. Chile5]|nr:hypothetical protein BBJ28_00015443 [Nothophytophthora sp. Chile5]